MDANITINVSKTDRGYSASCELLPGWVVAVTGDFADLKKEVKESIDFFIDCAKIDNEEYPQVFNEEYIALYKFDIQSLLCYYQNVFSFASLQNITGINQRQLWHYAAGRSKPRKPQAEKIVNSLHRLGNELISVSV